MTNLTKRAGGGLAALMLAPLALSACGDQASVSQAPSDPDQVISLAEGSGAPGGVSGGPLDVAPGSEVDPRDVVDRLMSADQSQLTSFTMMMSGQMEGVDLQMSAIVNVSDPAPEVDARVELSGAEVSNAGLDMLSNMHLIVADGGAYVSVPALTGQGQFFSIPADEADLDGLGMEGLGGGDEMDLMAHDGLEELWDGWEESGAQMTYVGSDDGVDEYQIVATMDGSDGQSQGDATFTVRIDEDNLMSELELGAQEGDLSVVFEDWGHNDDIVAPDADSLVEMDGFGF